MQAFTQMRTARDATLEMPVLILPSVQVNIPAGEFPPAEDNGVSYLKIPLNALSWLQVSALSRQPLAAAAWRSG